MEQNQRFVARMAVLVQRKPYLRYPVLAVVAGRLACYHFGRFLYSLRKKAALAAVTCGVVLVCGHTHLLVNAGSALPVYAGENQEQQPACLPEPQTSELELESEPELQTSPWEEREIVNVAGNIETEMLEVPAVAKIYEEESTAEKAEAESELESESEAESELEETGVPETETTQSEDAVDAAEQETTEENLFGWNLLLVNRSHPLTEEYRPQTCSVGYGIKVDVRIYDPLKAMLNEGCRQGCSLLVCSGYRSYERQAELYEEYTSKYVRRGYSYERACELTEETLLLPGTSEHQAGLAVDIVATTHQVLDAGFGDTKEGKWLAAHAHEYGFILRYPKDKVEITQIEYEPWHFRYVGVEAATEIYEMGCSLEEYIDILKERAEQGDVIQEAVAE